MSEIRDKLSVLEKEIARKQASKSTQKLVYLVADTVTVADLYVSVALCGGPRVPLKDGGDEKLYKAISKRSLDIREEYPVLYRWAQDVVKLHGSKK